MTFPVLPSVRALISQRCVAAFNETGRTLSSRGLIEAAHRSDAVILTATDRVDRDLLQQLPPGIQAIATYSVGYDHIDLDCAAERGLAVLNTPDVLTEAVAELAIFLMIGAARRATESVDLLRSRRWTGWTPVQLPGVQLSGNRLGIIGMGRIGSAVAQRARALGMEIHYTKTNRLSPQEEQAAIYHSEVEDVLAASQFLLLSCPSTPRTRGFLNRQRIALLPDGAIVINVARGDVVDDDSLVEALAAGKLRAAGLDVFANEPQLDERYFDLANVFMTPHIGSSTLEAREAMARLLLDGLDELDRGSWPPNRLV